MALERGKGKSGARDLSPGPHGPEPCVPRVLPYPSGSSSVLLYSAADLAISFRVLLYPLVPRMRDTAVTSTGLGD